MDKWVECIPNISEGRDKAVLDAIRAAVETTPGVYLLDDSADPDHHRSVFTFAGAPSAVTPPFCGWRRSLSSPSTCAGIKGFILAWARWMSSHSCLWRG